MGWTLHGRYTIKDEIDDPQVRASSLMRLHLWIQERWQLGQPATRPNADELNTWAQVEHELEERMARPSAPHMQSAAHFAEGVAVTMVEGL